MSDGLRVGDGIGLEALGDGVGGGVGDGVGLKEAGDEVGAGVGTEVGLGVVGAVVLGHSLHVAGQKARTSGSSQLFARPEQNGWSASPWQLRGVGTGVGLEVVGDRLGADVGLEVVGDRVGDGLGDRVGDGVGDRVGPEVAGDRVGDGMGFIVVAQELHVAGHSPRTAGSMHSEAMPSQNNLSISPWQRALMVGARLGAKVGVDELGNHVGDPVGFAVGFAVGT